LNRDGRSHVPLIGEFLKLRHLDNGTANPAYLYFCRHFLKCVVSSHTLRAIDGSVLLTTITTASDEAFLLLLIENNETCWTFCSRQQMGMLLPEEVAPHPKYTISPSRKQGGTARSTRRNAGWSHEGINRFNKFVALVRKDKKVFGQWFDKKQCQGQPFHFQQQSESRNPLGDSVVVMSVRAANDLKSDDDEDVEIYHSGGSDSEVDGHNQDENENAGDGVHEDTGDDGHTRDIWET
jgi:hypothetical protein